MSETALSLFNEETLKRITGMVNAGDTPAETGPETLKINYEEDSVYPRGSWVLGQKKDKDGNITEEGFQVSKVIILTTRCRWFYYDEATKTGVNTMMFESGEQPRDKADFDRKVAALGGDPRFQIVALGLAVVESSLKEFVAYISGSSYKLFRDHIKDITTYKLPTGGSAKVPPFVFITEFGESEKKKNGAVTYFIPSFKKGAEIPVSQIDMLAEKRDAAYQWIDYANSRAAEKKSEGESFAPPSAFPPASSPMVYAPPSPTPPSHSTGDRMPWEEEAPAAPPKAPKAPKKAKKEDEPAPEGVKMEILSPEDDFDIEAAMRTIMGDK